MRRGYDDRPPRDSRSNGPRPRNRDYDDRPPRERDPRDSRSNGPRPIDKPPRRDSEPRRGHPPESRSMQKKGKRPAKPKQKMELNLALGRNMGIVAVGILAIVALVVFINQLTNDNAFAVYLDGQFIAYITIHETDDQDTLADNLLAHARNSLENQLGSDVRIHQSQIRLEPTRASSRDHITRPNLNVMIRSELTYDLLAAAIYIDGTREALLRTEYDAQQVIDTLVDRYRNDNTVEYFFNREVIIRHIPFNDNLLLNTVAETVSRFRQPIRAVIHHTVQPGESLTRIASIHNTTVNDIIDRNDIADPDNVHPWTRLFVESSVPFLLIYTVDEFIEEIVIPPEYDDQPSNALAYMEVQILTNGTPGRAQREVRRTFENGQPYGEDEIGNEHIIIQPENGVRQVGTAQGN